MSTKRKLELIHEISSKRLITNRSNIEKKGDGNTSIVQSTADSLGCPHETPFVRVPHAKFPSSCFQEGSKLRVSSEDEALDDLLCRYPPTGDADEYVSFTLDDFEIYREPTAKHASTLASLNELNTVVGDNTYLFDGIIRYRQFRHRVQGIAFKYLGVEGYCMHTPTHCDIFLQSPEIEGRDIFYRLGVPSPRYAPYYKPYLWLATFGKHFVDFLEAQPTVCLADFRQDFYSFLIGNYGHYPAFDAWLKEYRRRDFRQVVAAHYEYLWKEATNVCENIHLHPIWGEIDVKQLSAIREQPVTETQTIVTPLIYSCFKNMYFSSHLKTTEIRPDVLDCLLKRAGLLNLSILPYQQTERHSSSSVDDFSLFYKQRRPLSCGDIVVLARDEDGVWKDDSPTWYAYIQGIKTDKTGQFLELIWLYRPSETILDSARYPFPYELFMSDHCNCTDSKTRPQHVKALLHAQFFVNASKLPDIPFIRQVYITPDEDVDKDAGFKTLKPEHLHCGHRPQHILRELERIKQCFLPKTTALIKMRNTRHLQPVVVMWLVAENTLKVSRLEWRARLDEVARPNELLITDEVFMVETSNVIRPCNVRIYDKQDVRSRSVPAPYSYDGAADCFCVTGRISRQTPRETNITDKVSDSHFFREGFDPLQTSHQLNGLSLFTGGGSFDRGLEEGRAVKTKWAIELGKEPLYTYRANLANVNDTSLYWGSVNDYLKTVLEGGAQGCKSQLFAKIDEVTFISAGSPCKGFTRANQNKSSEKASGYASLIASVLAFIAVYCPEYAILENVFDMCKGAGPDKKENVFSQVVATLVGMGYQVNTFLSDSWAHGSPQRRSRIFVTVTAPGLKPCEQPPQTHFHPYKTAKRSLGITKSGVKFGMRHLDSSCPFDCVSASQASADLPFIGDGYIRTVIPFPDHRLSGRDGFPRVAVPDWIPRYPLQSGYVIALKEGTMPKGLQRTFETRSPEWQAQNSQAYRRMDPNAPWPTVRTKGHPDDSRHGACLHWSQSRTFTIMEARRAQSIPDDEVLIGQPAQQYLIVGNGVDRKASVAMGLSLREAWFDNDTQHIINGREYLMGSGKSAHHATNHIGAVSFSRQEYKERAQQPRSG